MQSYRRTMLLSSDYAPQKNSEQKTPNPTVSTTSWLRHTCRKLQLLLVTWHKSTERHLNVTSQTRAHFCCLVIKHFTLILE